MSPRDPGPAASPHIPGVAWGSAETYADARGRLSEVGRTSAIDLSPGRTGMPGASLVQANVSHSAGGVLRGLHLHRRQLDRWYLVSGRAFVALVDVRPVIADPAARPLVETREIVADDWVEIPTGVAHGFLALEPLTLVYLVTKEYDGTDELGFAWDDPDAAIPWPRAAGTPDGLPMLSGRDRSNPSLRDLAARIREAEAHLGSGGNR